MREADGNTTKPPNPFESPRLTEFLNIFIFFALGMHVMHKMQAERPLGGESTKVGWDFGHTVGDTLWDMGKDIKQRAMSVIDVEGEGEAGSEADAKVSVKGGCMF